jgi:hypothetical protein
LSKHFRRAILVGHFFYPHGETLMKSFSKLTKLNQLAYASAAATAMIFVAGAATAQGVTNTTTTEGNAEFANALRAQQDAIAPDRMMKSQERAAVTARNLLGPAADTMNPDEAEAAIADRVPGFAGWVHSDDGKTIARMTRSSGLFDGAEQQGAAKQGDQAKWKSLNTPSATFAKSLGESGDVRKAQWDSRQLLDFKNKIFSMASAKGVIAVSIDRENNRLDVAYNQDLDAAGVQALTARMAGSGVPMVAMSMRAAELPKRNATVGTSLRSQPLPLAGGAQFNFSTAGGSFVCSVGVPARINGVQGFMTASHCSDRVYNLSARTRMTSPGGTFVGSETIDPAGRSCSLPDTLGCREADALFVSGGPANAVDFGKIMFTNTGSLTVTGVLNVQGTLNYPSVGQTIYKTGRTTGLTRATVARVCVDTLVSDPDGTYGALCSVEVATGSFIAGGDSGSSVWTYNGVGPIITGIVSYGSSNTGGFSPWGGVVKEFGAVTVR